MSRVLLLLVFLAACAEQAGGDGLAMIDPGGARPGRDASMLPPGQRPIAPPADAWVADAGSPGLDAAPIEADAGADPVECTPEAERCNAVDDDCDGLVDEDYELGAECSGMLDGCTVSGVLACNEAGVYCDTTGAQAGSPEVCDGQDNDCDGAVDEDFPGERCCVDSFACGLGEVCEGNRCVERQGGPDDPPPPGGAQTCDAPTPMNDFGIYQGDATEGAALHNGTCGGFVNPEVVFTFTRPQDQRIRLDTTGSLSDTVVYVRTNCADPNSEVACNDDDFLFESVVEMDAVGGQQYFAFVDGGLLGSGPFFLTFEPGAPVEPPPAASCDEVEVLAGFGRYEADTGGLPDDQDGSCVPDAGREKVWGFTLEQGGPVVLDLSDSDFDTVLSVRTACDAAGSEVDCNDDGGVGTRSRLAFDADPGVEYFVVAEGFRGAAGHVVLDFAAGEGEPPPPPDAALELDAAVGGCAVDGDCPGGRCIGGECLAVPALCADVPVADRLGVYNGTTAGQSRVGPQGCGRDGGAPEAIYVFAVAEPMELEFNTSGSDFDTVLYVLEGCADELACSDDAIGQGLTSRLTLNAQPGTVYAVVVDGYGAASGDYTLRVSAL